MEKIKKKSQLPAEEWHMRFSAQESWTNNIRTHVYAKLNLSETPKILEVGSGTGAILSKTPVSRAKLYGLDINFSYTRFCHEAFPQFLLACGDGMRLPYCDNAFDAVYCHYLLLWVANPAQIIREMMRVGISGGYIMLFAEPDYGGRIDHPASLKPLADAQTNALNRQGADPFIGRKLKEIAVSAGLDKFYSGILGNESDQSFSLPYWESEWQMLEHDLLQTMPSEELERYKQLDFQAQSKGIRTLFVPTFYLWAKIP